MVTCGGDADPAGALPGRINPALIMARPLHVLAPNPKAAVHPDHGSDIATRGRRRYSDVGDGQRSERRTEDGGAVSVYSDVTELKQREQDLSVKSTALAAPSAKLAKYLAPQVYDSIFTGQQDVSKAE